MFTFEVKLSYRPLYYRWLLFWRGACIAEIVQGINWNWLLFVYHCCLIFSSRVELKTIQQINSVSSLQKATQTQITLVIWWKTITSQNGCIYLGKTVFWSCLMKNVLKILSSKGIFHPWIRVCQFCLQQNRTQWMISCCNC